MSHQKVAGLPDSPKEIVGAVECRSKHESQSTAENVLRRLSSSVAHDVHIAINADAIVENQVEAAMAIVRHGYQTFLSMERISEREAWMNIQKKVLSGIISNQLLGKSDEISGRKKPKSSFIHLSQDLRPEAAKILRELDSLQNSQGDDFHNMIFADEESEEMRRFIELGRKEMKKNLRQKNRRLCIPQDLFDFLSKTFEGSEMPSDQALILDVVDVEKYRQEMNLFREQNDWEALGAKERQLVAHIFSEVIRFEYGCPNEFINDNQTHVIGTPMFAKEMRFLNCFTGPWMIASLLKKCGFPYGKMHYCEVHDMSAEWSAVEHGALLVRHSDGTSQFLDFAGKSQAIPFSTRFLTNPQEAQKLKEYFAYCDKNPDRNTTSQFYDPVHVHIDAKIADTLHVDRNFHVMELDQGFTGMMLAHVGIALENEEKVNDALMAYEWAHACNPLSPEILCRLAALLLQQKEDTRAEELLDEALMITSDHSFAMYYKGVNALRRGERVAAREWFQKVASDERRIWGDFNYKLQAEEYCDSLRKYELATIRLFLTDDEIKLL